MRKLNDVLHIAILLVLIASPSYLGAITQQNIHYISNPTYDNVPITPKSWEQVALTYTSIINDKPYTNSIQLLRPIKWLHQHHLDSRRCLSAF